MEKSKGKDTLNLTFIQQVENYFMVGYFCRERINK